MKDLTLWENTLENVLILKDLTTCIDKIKYLPLLLLSQENKGVIRMTKMESAIGKSKSRIDYKMEWADVVLVLVSLLLGRANIIKGLNPFGISFLASYIILRSPKISMLISGIIGTMMMQGLGGINYYLSYFLIYAFFTFYKDNKKYSLITSSVFTAGIFTFVSLLTLVLSKSFIIYDVLMTGFEAILIFTMTYVFSYSVPVEHLGEKKISNEKLICSFITLALILSSLNSMNIFGVSLKNLISIFLIMTLSYSQGIYTGATTGIILGLISYISNVEMPFVIAIFAVGGLLSGLFRELGKSGTVLGFILGNVIISYYIIGLGTSFLNYREIFVASIMFLTIYGKLETRINDIFNPISKVKKNYEDRKFEMASNKLNNISDALTSIAQTIKEEPEKEDVFANSSIYSIVDEVCSEKCMGCTQYNKCWKENYYTTYYSLFTAVGLLESNSDDELIKTIFDHCEDKENLVAAIKLSYRIYREKESLRDKIRQQRNVLTDQLLGIGKTLEDLDLNIYKNPTFNEELEELLFGELKNKRINISELKVAQLNDGHVEIYLEFETNNDLEKIERVTNIVSNSLGFPVKADYTLGSIERTNKFKLIRNNRYNAMSRAAFVPCKEHDISGDTYTFGEVDNTFFAAISDGMGRGEKAHIESTKAINMLEKMMEINMDKEIALKSINDIMGISSSDEMFATMDLSFVDLYTGKLQFIKSGTPPTFIKRKNQVLTINSLSFPIGIIKDLDFNIYEESLEDGDMIIMMSDGILDSHTKDNPDNWMKGIISQLDALNPQNMADEILSIAIKESDDEITDDMTVLVTKVWKNN